MMTPTEFFQSAYDCEPVLEASIDDLNAQTLQKVLCRQRQAHPRIFGQMTDSEMLSKLGILKEVEGKRHPTLAALLAFGTYPQQFFPKLCVTITQYAGIDKSTTTEDKPNVFSQTLCGPISDLLYNSVKLLVELTKIGDRQASFFPVIVLVEAMSNALQHRDYSPLARHASIEVNLFADRLEMTNPGGLYGPQSVELLLSDEARLSIARNQRLSMLLETTPFGDGSVVENRGAGLLTIRETLRYYGLPAPKIESSLTRFRLTLPMHRPLTSEAPLANDPTAKLFRTPKTAKIARELLARLAHRESMSAPELAQALELSRNSIFGYLKTLVASNLIEPTKPARSPDQRYRLKKSL